MDALYVQLAREQSEGRERRTLDKSLLRCMRFADFLAKSLERLLPCPLDVFLLVRLRRSSSRVSFASFVEEFSSSVRSEGSGPQQAVLRELPLLLMARVFRVLLADLIDAELVEGADGRHAIQTQDFSLR